MDGREQGIRITFHDSWDCWEAGTTDRDHRPLDVNRRREDGVKQYLLDLTYIYVYIYIVLGSNPSHTPIHRIPSPFPSEITAVPCSKSPDTPPSPETKNQAPPSISPLPSTSLCTQALHKIERQSPCDMDCRECNRRDDHQVGMLEKG